MPSKNFWRFGGETTARPANAGNASGVVGAALTPRLAVLLVIAVCVALFVIRLTGPSTLTDNDQQRPAAYVVDVVQNGQWLVQRNHELEIASKPPVYTWLAAGFSLLAGQVNLWTLYLPCLVATLTLALLILWLGGRHFGLMAGFIGALTLVLSPLGMKQIALARTDSVFALTVMLVFIAGWRAWNEGKSWIPFWLAAALATLTKGPLGIVLGAAGLLVAVRVRPGATGSRVWPGHVAGIALFLLIAGGWFFLAWRDSGQALIDTLIGKELLGHIVGRDALWLADASDGDGPGFEVSQLYMPTLYVLSRFAPWSLFAAAGLWRIFRHPAADPQVRRFEIYLACFFLVGLALFSLSSHQRGDLLYPLIPAAALLAGRELASLRVVAPTRRVLGVIMAVVLVVLGFAIYEYHVRLGEKPKMRFAERTRAFAAELDRRVGKDFPLIHVDSVYALQFHLETMRPKIDGALAAQALQSDHAAFVVVADRSEIDPFLGADAATLHEVMRWPQDGSPDYLVVSNHPRLEKTARIAFALPDLLVEMEGMRITGTTEKRVRFDLEGEDWRLALTNAGEAERKVEVEISGPRRSLRFEQVLAPGQRWVWRPDDA